jgi:hypothetical protein
MLRKHTITLTFPLVAIATFFWFKPRHGSSRFISQFKLAIFSLMPFSTALSRALDLIKPNRASLFYQPCYPFFNLLYMPILHLDITRSWGGIKCSIISHEYCIRTFFIPFLPMNHLTSDLLVHGRCN